MTASRGEEPPDSRATSADTKKKLSLWQIGGLVVLGVLLMLSTQFVWVCHGSGISVTFENQTDHEIRVSVVNDPDRGPGFDAVGSGETRTLSYLSRNSEVFRVVIVDERAGTLLDEIFTIDQLEARGMRFVVDDEGVQQNSDALPD